LTGKKWRIGLNSVTLKGTPLDEAVEAAGRTGFDGFGFWVKDLRPYAESEGSLVQLKDKLASLSLDPCELLAVRKWQEFPLSRFGPAEEEARRVFELASAIGSKVVTSPASASPHSIDELPAALSRICDIATSYDITIAFEFIAGRPISNLHSAIRVVRAAKKENAGILLDVFHLHKSGSPVGGVLQLDPAEVAIVHMNDVIDRPREMLRDKDRLYPGDGVAEITSLVQALHEIGYTGYFSVEIFNDLYWSMDPYIVAKEALDKTRAALQLDEDSLIQPSSRTS